MRRISVSRLATYWVTEKPLLLAPERDEDIRSWVKQQEAMAVYSAPTRPLRRCRHPPRHGATPPAS